MINGHRNSWFSECVSKLASKYETQTDYDYYCSAPASGYDPYTLEWGLVQACWETVWYGNASEGCKKKEYDDCKLNQPFGSTANVASGNLSHSQDVFSSSGSGLSTSIEITYNSKNASPSPLGMGWTHTYNIRLAKTSSTSFTLTESDGKKVYLINKGAYYSPKDSAYPALRAKADGTGYNLYRKEREFDYFDNDGRLTSIQDLNGDTITFAYDSLGNLTKITDAHGSVTGLEYDAFGHVTRITSPNGSVYTFTYNSGNLSSVAYPDGGVWAFTYDSKSRMLTKTDPKGNTTRYEYDASGRVVKSTDAEGKTRGIVYSQTSSISKFTDISGAIWMYQYDKSIGKLIKKTDPLGNVTQYAYDSSGNTISRTDGDGTTSYEYDTYGNVITVIEPTGEITRYTYNELSLVTSITDSQGQITQYAYDAKGNMTSVTDATRLTTAYGYDEKGRLTQITAPDGTTTRYAYDQKGNLSTVTDSTGAITRFTYDQSGNLISITSPDGSVTKYEYDLMGRRVKSIDGLGNVTLYSYDAMGNVASTTDANGNVTRYEYDHKGRVIRVIDAMGYATAYEYDGAGGCSSCGNPGGSGLSGITDANGHTTIYNRDILGRVVSETDPMGNAITYGYDNTGRMTSRTDAMGNTIAYGYDAKGRLVKKTYPDGTTEEFAYDAKGNMTYAGNKDIAYNMTYDGAGRTLSVTDSDGKIIAYEYDAYGKKTKTTSQDGGVINYAYDASGRLIEMNSTAGKFAFGYDSSGRRVKLSYPNGAYAKYEYDSAGRLTALVHKDSRGKVIDSFKYMHDKVGNRLSKTMPDESIAYGYDAIYRLTAAVGIKDKERHHKDHEDHKGERYSYDPVGNRLSGPGKKDGYSYNEVNQLLADKRNGYEYDKNGNLIKKITDEGETVYEYDYENRLIRVTITGTEEREKEGRVVEFAYDPFGRRILKKVIGDDDGEAKTHRYFYDNEDIVLEERSKDDHLKKIRKVRYTHGPEIDEPLAIENDGEVYYYHADALASIIDLTDKRGRVIQGYEYDSFGKIKHQGGKVKQWHAYIGKEWDKETGLLYVSARYYDPSIGRFITYDPSLRNRGDTGNIPYLLPQHLKYPKGLHPYSYSENNPVTYNDPSGLVAPAIIGVCLASPACSGAILTGGALIIELIKKIPPPEECDDEDYCYKREAQEMSYCYTRPRKWWNGCINRANTRRDLCLRGLPEPAPWSPADEEVWVNPSR